MEGNYSNRPNSKAIGRILHDRREIEKTQHELMDVDEIFFSWNDGRVDTDYLQLIIGPPDTPYEGGFFFFTAQLPDNYPFSPMKMKIETQGDNVRQHPNYYKDGKCCLSFLGTWEGPPWSACQNMLSIAHTMKSLYTTNPLQNEPGFETVNDFRSKLYEDMVGYWTIKVAVCKMMRKRPRSDFDVFYNVMNSKFLKYYPIYVKNLEKYRKYDKTRLDSPVYTFELDFDIESLKNELESIYKDIGGKLETIEDKARRIYESIPKLENSAQTVEEKEEKEEKKRKVPNEKPNKFEIGYEMVSENDGRKYFVKEIKSGVKRWVLVK